MATAPAASAQDAPLVFSRFVIQQGDGFEIASFSELAGITSEVVVIDDRASNLRTRTQGAVALGRPATVNMELWAWHESAVTSGARSRQDLMLVALSPEGQPVMRYHLKQAWPSKIEIGALKAGASEVLMETVTITCEHLQRVAP
jgi:phage tail-like protein